MEGVSVFLFYNRAASSVVTAIIMVVVVVGESRVISQALHPPKEVVEYINTLNSLWLREQKEEFPSIIKDIQETTNKNMRLLMWGFSYMDAMFKELFVKVSGVHTFCP